MFGSTEAIVEKNCGLLGIKSDTIEGVAQIASLQAAWASVRIFQVAQEKANAENRLMGIPNAVRSSDYTTMKLSYERLHEKTPDARLPGITLIERLEAEIEEGVFTAPHLNEIPSKAEVTEASKAKNDSLGLAITFTSTGAKMTQPVRVKLNMPSCTEELRDRIRLLEAAVEFIKIRSPLSAIFSSSNAKVWKDHLEYILGPKVRGRTCNDMQGKVAKVPEWELILHYEYAIRAKACELMNEGDQDNGNKPMDIALAMKTARNCRDTKDESS